MALASKICDWIAMIFAFSYHCCVCCCHICCKCYCCKCDLYSSKTHKSGLKKTEQNNTFKEESFYKKKELAIFTTEEPSSLLLKVTVKSTVVEVHNVDI